MTEKKLEIYEQARAVPKEAQKPINAGRLKGMTDINPMHRIKRLTEIFGPCGVGWWYEITDKRIVEDSVTKQSAAFVDILLYYVWEGKTSHAIPGTGGSSFVAQERNGPYLSDECFKMALTDAISVAAKALGLGADIYYAADRSKYSNPPEQAPPPPAQQRQTAPTPPAPPVQGYDGQQRMEPPSGFRCADCGKPIDARVNAFSTNRYGRPLCRDCQSRQR